MTKAAGAGAGARVMEDRYKTTPSTRVIAEYFMQPVDNRHYNCNHIVEGKLRGSQGMGVVSNSCFDSVLLSIRYMFKPSC